MKLRTAGVFLLIFSATGLSFANSLPACAPLTPITQLQASGGCVIGNLRFSNFQYNNSGLGNGNNDVPVTPANILVTATLSASPSSTDYGLGGGFSNCLGINFSIPWDCIEEEGSLGYDVSVVNGDQQIAGLGMLGGVADIDGGHVAEIACLGLHNVALVFNVGFVGYLAGDVPYVCPENSSASVLLNASGFSPNSPTTALFSPRSAMSIAISLSVDHGFGANVTAISNAFYLVQNKCQGDDQSGNCS
jgi:hypothetical protein